MTLAPTIVGRCLLLCKDKNFKANHNYRFLISTPNQDVCYSAKIRILKQITTYSERCLSRVWMFVTLQR